MSRESVERQMVELRREFDWTLEDNPPIKRWDGVIDELLKDKPLINAGDIFANHWDDFLVDDSEVTISMRKYYKDGLVQRGVRIWWVVDSDNHQVTTEYQWSNIGGLVLVVDNPMIYEDGTEYNPFSSIDDHPDTIRERRKITTHDYQSIDFMLTKLAEEN